MIASFCLILPCLDLCHLHNCTYILRQHTIHWPRFGREPSISVRRDSIVGVLGVCTPWPNTLYEENTLLYVRVRHIKRLSSIFLKSPHTTSTIKIPLWRTRYGYWILLTSLGLISFCFLLSPAGGGEWRPSGEVGLFCSRAASPLAEADWRRFLDARPLGPAEKMFRFDYWKNGPHPEPCSNTNWIRIWRHKGGTYI